MRQRASTAWRDRRAQGALRSAAADGKAAWRRAAAALQPPPGLPPAGAARTRRGRGAIRDRPTTRGTPSRAAASLAQTPSALSSESFHSAMPVSLPQPRPASAQPACALRHGRPGAPRAETAVRRHREGEKWQGVPRDGPHHGPHAHPREQLILESCFKTLIYVKLKYEDVLDFDVPLDVEHCLVVFDDSRIVPCQPISDCKIKARKHNTDHSKRKGEQGREKSKQQ